MARVSQHPAGGLQAEVKRMGGGRGPERLPEQGFKAPGRETDTSRGGGGRFGRVDPRLHPGQSCSNAGIERGVRLLWSDLWFRP
jgi:hypothetical protein